MKGYVMRFCKSEHCKCKVAHEQEYKDSVWVWKCYNCGLTTPIRKRSPNKAEENGMTKQQNRMIEVLRRRMITAYAGDPDLYEYKEFTVEVKSGLVFLLAVVGRKGDEGTNGAVYGRERRHVVVGLNGGLKLLNAKDPKKSKGLHNVLFAQRSY